MALCHAGCAGGATSVACCGVGDRCWRHKHTLCSPTPRRQRRLHPQALHARLQPLLLFFVDAASVIDATDPAWHLLTAVEQSPEGMQVLGFATCYRHYHYPAGARLRLAQILVLPPHQGRGAGGMLLGAAQALADSMDACDMAVRVGGWRESRGRAARGRPRCIRS